MPFKAPSSPNYSERVPPPLHSPSSAIYPQKTPTSYSPTSERSIESNFDSREPRMVRRDARDEVQHDFYGLSQNYQTPSQTCIRNLCIPLVLACIHSHITTRAHSTVNGIPFLPIATSFGIKNFVNSLQNKCTHGICQHITVNECNSRLSYPMFVVIIMESE
jgi:hypothetical protein